MEIQFWFNNITKMMKINLKELFRIVFSCCNLQVANQQIFSSDMQNNHAGEKCMHGM